MKRSEVEDKKMALMVSSQQQKLKAVDCNQRAEKRNKRFRTKEVRLADADFVVAADFAAKNVIKFRVSRNEPNVSDGTLDRNGNRRNEKKGPYKR